MERCLLVLVIWRVRGRESGSYGWRDERWWGGGGRRKVSIDGMG